MRAVECDFTLFLDVVLIKDEINKCLAESRNPTLYIGQLFKSKINDISLVNLYKTSAFCGAKTNSAETPQQKVSSDQGLHCC